VTTPIDNSSRRIIRTQTAPVQRPVARPEIQRTNTAPARNPVRDGMDRTARPAASNGAPAATAGGIFGKLKDFAKNWKPGVVEKGVKDAVASGVGKLGILKSAGGAVGGAFGVYSGVKNVINGIKNHDGHQIAGGALGATKGALNTVKGGLATAAAIESHLHLRGLEKAATAAIGDGSKLGKAIAKSAAEAVHLGKDLTKLDVLGQAAKSTGFLGKMGTALKSGAAGLLTKLPKGIGAELAGKLNANIIKTGALALGGEAKGVATALKTAETATKAAGAAAKGAGTAAKLAGRFAPGVNVGIAALDVGIAIKTITDPKASIASKVTSGITALGSVAAATNIPIVSQVGAAVSIASTAVGAAIENFGAIKDTAAKVGSAVADGAKKVGSAIADGAKKIFSGW
jgi:hypothetical protein